MFAQNVQSKIIAVFLALILLICFEFIFFFKGKGSNELG